MNTIGVNVRGAKRGITMPVAPFDIPPAPKKITRARGRVTDASSSAILSRPLRQYPVAQVVNERGAKFPNEHESES